MLDAVLTGLLLGFSAGLSPGPLLALVLAQTLRHGTREGCRVALVPLITDAPVIFCSVVLATQLPGFHTLLGVLSLGGGMFVLYLAWESFRPPRVEEHGCLAEPRSWRKGVATNMLSPNPWIFWFTVGAATLTKTGAGGWAPPAAFLLAFYASLCGSKMLLAVVTGQSRDFLSGRVYRLILAAMGVALAVFAIMLFRDGFRYLGLLAAPAGLLPS